MQSRTMTRFLAAILAALTAAAAVAGRAKTDYGQYGAILQIRSPQDLVFPTLPAHYRVPVVLSGGLAAEICTAFARLKLDAPQFEELMPEKGVFKLSVSNADFSADTREMLAGILNPVEMIDLVINSVAKYRSRELFDQMVRETRITVRSGEYAGRRVQYLELTPTGERFGYEYEDKGVFVAENWLTRLVLTADSSSHLLYELSATRLNRRRSLDQTVVPRTDTVRTRYVFSYVYVGARVLPSQLELFVADSLSLTITAAYRQEGRCYVFNSRSICHGSSGNANGCLRMTYGAYSFEKPPAAAVRPGPPADYDRQLQQAGRLSTKAADELRAGRITRSVRLLEEIVERYPQTPQAAEARKLISSLPKGL